MNFLVKESIYRYIFFSWSNYVTEDRVTVHYIYYENGIAQYIINKCVTTNNSICTNTFHFIIILYTVVSLQLEVP